MTTTTDPNPTSSTTAAIPLQPIIDTYEADPAMTPQKWVQWACDCAERVLGEWETRYPDDTRPSQAIAASRRWVANPTKTNAYAAARAAADAADAADAAYAAADAAYVAANAAYAAAYAANAAYVAAYAAAHAAHAAAYAARAAAYAAAYAAYAAADAAHAATNAAYAAEEQWQAIHLMGIYHA
jgi:hypothetical protein